MQTLEKELLEMSHHWKDIAREMIAKSENGSRSEIVNRMLFCCAEMLEFKIRAPRAPLVPPTVNFNGQHPAFFGAAIIFLHLVQIQSGGPEKSAPLPPLTDC